MYSSKGVTIVELLVVLSIFVFVIVTAVSIFVSTTQQQKSILKEQELLNQVSYVIEYMSRRIRMTLTDANGVCPGFGYDYLLTNYDSVSGFYQGIKFISDDNNCYEFFLDTDGIFKMRFQNNLYSLLSPSQFDNFTIKYVRFIINGDKIIGSNSASNPLGPRITTSLDFLISQKEKVFQTTVSRRNLMRLFQ